MLYHNKNSVHYLSLFLTDPHLFSMSSSFFSIKNNEITIPKIEMTFGRLLGSTVIFSSKGSKFACMITNEVYA